MCYKEHVSPYIQKSEVANDPLCAYGAQKHIQGLSPFVNFL